jgi:hypothetical protein
MQGYQPEVIACLYSKMGGNATTTFGIQLPGTGMVPHFGQMA